MVTLSTRLLAGWLLAVRLRRHGTRQVSDEWRRRVQTLSRRLRVSRPVRVLESVVVQVPAVVGWLRPVLLLPASALAGLTPTQLEAVIAHELAHIRRHDYLVNGLQTAVETLLFYHPAVWWVSTRIRQKREHCCDDVAIALCGDPVEYGRALVVAASGGSLTARIRRLVDGPVPPPRPALAGLVLCGVAAALTFAVVVGSSEAAAESPEHALVGAVTHDPARCQRERYPSARRWNHRRPNSGFLSASGWTTSAAPSISTP